MSKIVSGVVRRSGERELRISCVSCAVDWSHRSFGKSAGGSDVCDEGCVSTGSGICSRCVVAAEEVEVWSLSFGAVCGCVVVDIVDTLYSIFERTTKTCVGRSA